jgi:hypothetical protein
LSYNGSLYHPQDMAATAIIERFLTVFVSYVVYEYFTEMFG